eukprot:TRINITY_DN11819_c0_g1_i2.p1 TRINITY_DN11819_c0_g1~~TRINITY_DN11819_c0_g1_i2.p1  ORF type:complete len:164 (+),score=32.74 TRINITY_DN11819_c0_g1_i2:214-705(+)
MPFLFSSSFRSIDVRGGRISLFPHVLRVWDFIRTLPHAQISIASRTETPDRAREVLGLLKTPWGNTMMDNVVHAQIYPGSKMKHMRRLHEITGVAYEDMIFFDDESRNREVERLGVTFVLIDEDEGLSEAAFCQGLWTYANMKIETKMKQDDPDTKGHRPPRY